MRIAKFLNILLPFIILFHNALATIINIPDDYPTIVEGVEASISGDTVLVAPGIYEEDITFGGKNILLTSSHGPDTTRIYGQIRFEDGEDSTCVLRGFYVSVPSIYSSILCGSGTSPIIEGNIISNNWGFNGLGSGIGVFNSACTIRNNIISNNGNLDGAGGIGVGGNGSRIEKNIIKGNVSYGYFAIGGGIKINGNAFISYNLFIDNQAIGNPEAAGDGGGIFRILAGHQQADITCIVNNTFARNIAQGYNTSGRGGAINNISGNPDDSLIIKNNIFAFNIASSDIGSGAYVGVNDSMYLYWDYNCVYENTVDGIEPGSHDVFLDPLFVDTLNDDFHLLPDSPCIDAGDPESPFDPDSTRADIGAFFYDQTVDIDNPRESTGPYNFQLNQNYPNPFNSQTVISYFLRKSEKVTLRVFSITGQLVFNLISSECQEAGNHELTWDGNDNQGNPATTGIYFYQLRIGGYRESKAMIVIR